MATTFEVSKLAILETALKAAIEAHTTERELRPDVIAAILSEAHQVVAALNTAGDVALV